MMKHIGCMLLTAALLAALAGCAPQPQEAPDAGLETAGQQTGADSGVPEGGEGHIDLGEDAAGLEGGVPIGQLQGLEGLHTLLNPDYEAWSGVLKGDIYYNIEYPVDSYNNGGLVLYKTDLTTLKHTAVDSLEEGYGATMFLTPNGEICAMVSYENNCAIYRLGAGDKLEPFIETDSYLRGQIATDGSSLYMMGYDKDYKHLLLRAPVSGGSFEVVTSLQAEGELVGAEGGLLYLRVQEGDEENNLVALSPVDGQLSSLFSYTAWPGNGLVQDGMYYYPAHDGGATQVMGYRIATGEKDILAQLEPVPELWIKGFWGGRLFIIGFDMNRAEPPFYDHYTLDLADGGLYPMALHHKNSTENMVEMLAETGDSFLVTNSYNWFKTTTPGKDGGSYPVEDMYRGFALIPKSDFWANSPSYTDIEMNT